MFWDFDFDVLSSPVPNPRDSLEPTASPRTRGSGDGIAFDFEPGGFGSQPESIAPMPALIFELSTANPPRRKLPMVFRPFSSLFSLEMTVKDLRQATTGGSRRVVPVLDTALFGTY